MYNDAKILVKMDEIATKSSIFLLYTPWCTDAYIVQGDVCQQLLGLLIAVLKVNNCVESERVDHAR